MGSQDLSLATFNWRRELLLVSMAAMETSWLAGWAVILLGTARTVGLLTAWLSTFALYLIAITTARTLIRRRSTRSDWIIGGLVLISTLIFTKLNLYPTVGLINPKWLGMMMRNVASGLQAWPRELTALFVGFFVWFRGLRLPRRHMGIRTMTQHVQIGLAVIVGLVIVSTGFPIKVSGLVIAYFAAGLLVLALTRIEETAQTEGGAVSPFGRKWLATLAVALLIVGVTALIASNIFTVEIVRTLLGPLVGLAVSILSAYAFLLAVFVQYILFPIVIRLFGDRISLEDLDLQRPEPFQREEVEGATRLLISPAFLNALRVTGLFLLTAIALWLVIRSFRRWRVVRETAGGTRETVRPAGTLADDVLDYLRDRWRRLRELADLRRLLQLRGAGSIRAIYTNLLMLMAAADHPRQAGQTPYEFEPTVEQVLPEREAEISAITEAYVRARYGEQNISDAELRNLREAWRRVQTDGEKLIEGRS
ncbi:MAG: DUF4129 domain-containing protein [Anaerolineae bacterium]